MFNPILCNDSLDLNWPGNTITVFVWYVWENNFAPSKLDELKESWNGKNPNYICISTQKLAEILNARWFQICCYRYQVSDVTIYKFSKYTVCFKFKEMCALDYIVLQRVNIKMNLKKELCLLFTSHLPFKNKKAKKKNLA